MTAWLSGDPYDASPPRAGGMLIGTSVAIGGLILLIVLKKSWWPMAIVVVVLLLIDSLWLLTKSLKVQSKPGDWIAQYRLLGMPVHHVVLPKELAEHPERPVRHVHWFWRLPIFSIRFGELS